MDAVKIIAVAILALAVGACGFRPIYATPTGEKSALNQRIQIQSVTAGSETMTPIVTKALMRRISLKDGQSPEYHLYVSATERAQRLAVQIDNTTTRYNYRLRARYTLINVDTGKRINGRANAVTSYNIVNSQYSTLFAENTAREKAARLLAEEIERDLLLRLVEKEWVEEDAPELLDFRIDPRTNTITDPDREVIVPDPFESTNREFAVPDPLIDE